MEPITLPLLVNVLVAAGAFALLAFLGARTFRTPLWMPVLLLCSGLAGYALLEGAGDQAADLGDDLLGRQLDLAAQSGIAAAIVGLLHLAALFPRRVDAPLVSAGLLAAYGLALFSVFLAPTRMVYDSTASGPDAFVVSSGGVSDILLLPLYGGLFLTIGWFGFLAVRARNETERRAARNMAASVGVPLAIAGLVPLLQIPFEAGEEALLLMALWIGAIVFVVATGGLPLPVQTSLRRVMESSQDAIIIVDGQKIVVTVNAAAVRLFALAPGWAGQPLEGLLRPAYRNPASWEATNAHIDKCLGAGSSGAHATAEQPGPQGQPMRVLVDPLGKSALGARAPGAVLRLSNLSAEKAAQRSKKQAQDLQDLVIRVMGHDLKAPIMVIGGYLQIADGRLSGPVDDKGREGLRAALQKAGQAASLMNVIMANARAISRLTMGENAPPSFEQLDLSKMVGDVSEVLKPLADAKQITLKLEKPERLVVPLVPGFESVITNLLSNAIKFTPVGGAVGVKLVSDDSHVGIEVWDSGPGVEPEKRYKLFHKFERLGATPGETEGHGLGLSIAAQIVELSGGTIAVGDKEDGSSGASFTVEIPLEQPKAPAAASA